MVNRITIHHTMPKRNAGIKQKRTFSLSPEALEYLETVRKQKKSPSTSTVLDELIRERKLAAQFQETAASITGYYDSLTDEEQSENSAWGHFGTSQFPTE